MSTEQRSKAIQTAHAAVVAALDTFDPGRGAFDPHDVPAIESLTRAADELRRAAAPPTLRVAYETVRAQRDAAWPDWGPDGAPEPATERERLWLAQGRTEGLAEAMTILEGLR